MTALIGIYCQDGVVIGADSAATSATAGGQPTVEQPILKINIIAGKLIIAGTGAVGLGQRFNAVIDKLWQTNGFRNQDEIGFAKTAAVAGIKDFGETGATKGSYGALMAYPCKDMRNRQGLHLVEFSAQDFQPEQKNSSLWYVSMGSGQNIIDPFLAFMREIFWKDGPPRVQDGVFAATWLLDHAVRVNPGGVNSPVRIATLENSGSGPLARLLEDDELLEHRQYQRAAKDALRNFKEYMELQSGAQNIPEPPKALS